jgi:hypothetical protein
MGDSILCQDRPKTKGAKKNTLKKEYNHQSSHKWKVNPQNAFQSTIVIFGGGFQFCLAVSAQTKLFITASTLEYRKIFF